MSRPSLKNNKRVVAKGMGAPTDEYRATTIAQMQTAIEDLARKIDALRTLSPTAQEKAASRRTPVTQAETAVTAEGGVDPSTYGGRPVQPEPGASGASKLYARGDHTHMGQPYQVYGGQPPSGGYQPGTFSHSANGERIYGRVGIEWRCLTHVE